MKPSKRRAAFSRILLGSSLESSLCFSLCSVWEWSFLCEVCGFPLTAKGGEKNTRALFWASAGCGPLHTPTRTRLLQDVPWLVPLYALCLLAFPLTACWAALPLPLSLPSRYLPSYSDFPSFSFPFIFVCLEFIFNSESFLCPSANMWGLTQTHTHTRDKSADYDPPTA